MGSDDENEIDTKALLKMINGLAKASSASVARLNDVENKLAVKDQALAKVESDLGEEADSGISAGESERTPWGWKWF